MMRLRPSPLTLLLSCVLLFATHVFAVSAVLGIDLGTEYITAALVKPGIPLEIVLTKDARRKEASTVAFKPSRSAQHASRFPERLYGSDALSLAARFPADVYPNLKHLLGLPVDHAIVQEYTARHPGLQLETDAVRGTAAFKSKAFTAEEDAWMVEELLAMELQNIRKNAEAAAGDGFSVQSIVLTVPPYFTVEERRALELAAELAGLKVLSLISDGLAVGLNYATTRYFPNIDDGHKPEYHMVFDMGAGSAKATVMRFQSRTVKDVAKLNRTVQEVAVLGAGWDRTLGGDALNSLIIDDMVSQFVASQPAQKLSIQADSVKTNGRTIAKLTKEAERLRHILSANTNTQGSFESLHEDVDFKYQITRADFEAMAEGHAARVNSVIQDALKMAQLDISDMDSVILNGGATRTPFVQKQLKEIDGVADKIRTNVNSDESAVFGAGFRAAELSPSFRVKEIRISEGAMYPSGMRWTTAKGKEQHQRVWSAVSPQGAAPKELTFHHLEDFQVTFYQQVSGEERDTSRLSTKNLTDTVAALKEKYACNDGDIHFKVAVKLGTGNGEVEVTKAAVECEADVPESFVDGVKNLFGFGKRDQKPLTDGEDSENAEGAEAPAPVEASASSATESATGSASAEDETTSSTSSGAEAEASPASKRELVSIPVKVTVEKATPALSKEDIKKSKTRLQAFEASDKVRVQTEEALNQLEGFTYKVRDLLENESFLAACTNDERTTLEQKSREAGEWLDGDGADAPRSELKAKYKELYDMATRVQKRSEESEKRPELVTALKDALNETATFVKKTTDEIQEYEDWHAKKSAEASATASLPPGVTGASQAEDEEPVIRSMEDVLKVRGPVPPLYTREDVGQLEKLYDETTKWLREMEAKQSGLPATADPVLLIKDLAAKREQLDKAGADLVMRGVRNYQKKNKKSSSSASAKQSKTSSSTSTATSEKPAGVTINVGGESHFIKHGENGEGPSDEQLQEIIKKIQEDQNKREQEGKPARDEL
ncbi:stress protein ORP150 [Sodiomyces alkalinus F11]|uniref:Stress protein ORP150 n=1 Tax=Sodiomyces alkalinus (strain CBS 110278 / VKM F-3762 / F11) TaxID=1314773 RepID=A0A3N2PPF5_SODAK|nr:stress protein ORP150 [Sodiomyces alkalinus F11]ROT36395.1 stress protein ORP150 [Sodiomyces alkalinus F11]